MTEIQKAPLDADAEILSDPPEQSILKTLDNDTAHLVELGYLAQIYRQYGFWSVVALSVKGTTLGPLWEELSSRESSLEDQLQLHKDLYLLPWQKEL
jgi:hypothetical protein